MPMIGNEVPAGWDGLLEGLTPVFFLRPRVCENFLFIMFTGEPVDLLA